jgi:nitrate/nitrite transporter NarK
MEDDYGSIESAKPQQDASSAQAAIEASGSTRALILAAACLLTFGSYFCYDTPSALVITLREKLQLTGFQYNVLFSIYSWPNVVLVFIGGLVIDTYGSRRASLALATLVLVGQVVMLIGVLQHRYWLLLSGRFIFGMGGESLGVCQSIIVSRWFAGHELATAFGLSLTVSRIGSILSFMLLPVVDQVAGIVSAFAVGVIICALSICAALVYASIELSVEHKRAEGAAALQPTKTRTRAPAGERSPRSRRSSLLQVARCLDLSFWLCAGISMVSYALVFSFIAIGSDLLHQAFGTSRERGSLLVSLVYDFSMVLAPLLGRLFDAVGLRGIFVLVSCTLNLLSFALLEHTRTSAWQPVPRPVYGMICMGVAFSGLSSSVWPSMTVISPVWALGAALGIAQALQNLGTSLMSIYVGHVVDAFGYEAVLSRFVLIACIAVLLALWWNIDDWRYRDGRVNRSAAAAEAAAAAAMELPVAAGTPQGAAVAYVPLYVPVYVMVSPEAIQSVRRACYQKLGESEVGIRRRDLYAQLGIAHPAVVRKAAETGAQLPAPDAYHARVFRPERPTEAAGSASSSQSTN